MHFAQLNVHSFFKKIGCSIICLFASAALVAQEKPEETDTTLRVRVLPEIVISASRLSEKQLSAPVSISKLSSSQIQQTASPSFFDAIGSMKGVHMIVPSMGFKIINTRGFSNTTNVRFVQMIDNIDNQSPHIGAPIANALSPGDLDIDHGSNSGRGFCLVWHECYQRVRQLYYEGSVHHTRF